MTLRDPRVYLDDILDAITGIRGVVHGLTIQQFKTDWMRRRAVERGVEIISVASRRLPADLKVQHPGIPWNDIAGIGNVLRHDYGAVNPQIVWDVTQRDLCALKDAIEAMMASLDAAEE